MRGSNFEDTLKMALSKLSPTQIDAIKEVDEDCYDNSNYNSRAQFEPLNQSADQGGSKADPSAAASAPRDERTGEFARGNTKLNFTSESEDDLRGELPPSPMMTVVGPSGSLCKNVMNNISQTTKIIINNIGREFTKKRERTDPAFEAKGSDKEAADGNQPSFRGDKSSGERHSWVNYNFSRPISKRSSEDASQNEFVVKELPRRTSSSIENSAVFRHNDGDERRSFVQEFNPLRRASFREPREHGLDWSCLEPRDQRRWRRFLPNGDVLGQRRPRFLSSTASQNIVAEPASRARKSEGLDIRSCLFGGPGRRPEGGPREAKRVSALVWASFRK